MDDPNDIRSNPEGAPPDPQWAACYWELHSLGCIRKMGLWNEIGYHSFLDFLVAELCIDRPFAKKLSRFLQSANFGHGF